jgi:hypothetical protein
MRYFWNIEVKDEKVATFSQNTLIVKACRPHTAISYAVKYLAKNSKIVKVTCIRMREVKKIQCECGKKYDEDEKRCPCSWRHEVKE